MSINELKNELNIPKSMIYFKLESVVEVDEELIGSRFLILYPIHSIP